MLNPFLPSLINQGGLIAYATEAVWGFGCDPFNEAAVRRLLALKQRPEHKGLIVVAADISQISPLLAQLTLKQIEQLQSHWPGAVTFLIPNLGYFPSWVTGQSDKIAVRISAHPRVRQICQACGPIISTSANRAGKEPARTELQVRSWFGNEIDLVVPGKTGSNQSPSKIFDLISGQQLR